MRSNRVVGKLMTNRFCIVTSRSVGRGCPAAGLLDAVGWLQQFTVLRMVENTTNRQRSRQRHRTIRRNSTSRAACSCLCTNNWVVSTAGSMSPKVAAGGYKRHEDGGEILPREEWSVGVDWVRGLRKRAPGCPAPRNGATSPVQSKPCLQSAATVPTVPLPHKSTVTPPITVILLVQP